MKEEEITEKRREIRCDDNGKSYISERKKGKRTTERR